MQGAGGSINRWNQLYNDDVTCRDTDQYIQLPDIQQTDEYRRSKINSAICRDRRKAEKTRYIRQQIDIGWDKLWLQC